jgi:hypothetical protein
MDFGVRTPDRGSRSGAVEPQYRLKDANWERVAVQDIRHSVDATRLTDPLSKAKANDDNGDG